MRKERGTVVELTLAARLILAGVFATAGLGKVADRSGAQRVLGEFGLPGVLGRALSVALPGAELAVAFALIPASTSRVGAAGALTLLGAFSLAVAVNLARGRTPDCHCFGQVHTRPIGAGTLARNAVLGAASALVLLGPDGTVGAWWGDLDRGDRLVAAAAGALAVVVALQGWVLLHLLRQQGRLVLRLDALEGMVGGDAGDRPGLPVGTAAPSFALPDPWGAVIILEELLAPGRPLLLLFADPGCGPCNELFPDIARWQRDWRDRITIAVVSAGSAEANRAKATEHGLVHLVVQERREVAAAYATTATPSAVLVATDGRVASPLVAGGDAIWKLLLRTPAPAGALSREIEITV
ncbi:MAG: redoxin domain-containing protein [Actinomycetota bacterium]|nr:redoxin domain-containing protein [Actinomycetota bacterium]